MNNNSLHNYQIMEQKSFGHIVYVSRCSCTFLGSRSKTYQRAEQKIRAHIERSKIELDGSWCYKCGNRPAIQNKKGLCNYCKVV